MTAFATAAAGSGGGRIVSFILLGVLVVIVVLAIVRLRPALRKRRHEAWREAGLLPEQLDLARRPDDEEPR